MKKLIITLLICSLLITASCGKKNDNQEQNQGQTQNQGQNTDQTQNQGNTQNNQNAAQTTITGIVHTIINTGNTTALNFMMIDSSGKNYNVTMTEGNTTQVALGDTVDATIGGAASQGGGTTGGGATGGGTTGGGATGGGTTGGGATSQGELIQVTATKVTVTKPFAGKTEPAEIYKVQNITSDKFTQNVAGKGWFFRSFKDFNEYKTFGDEQGLTETLNKQTGTPLENMKESFFTDKNVYMFIVSNSGAAGGAGGGASGSSGGTSGSTDGTTGGGTTGGGTAGGGATGGGTTGGTTGTEEALKDGNTLFLKISKESSQSGGGASGDSGGTSGSTDGITGGGTTGGGTTGGGTTGGGATGGGTSGATGGSQSYMGYVIVINKTVDIADGILLTQMTTTGGTSQQQGQSSGTGSGTGSGS